MPISKGNRKGVDPGGKDPGGVGGGKTVIRIYCVKNLFSIKEEGISINKQ